jgi:hypothetical protein
MEKWLKDKESTFLNLHTLFQGYTLPMKGKAPDAQMIKRQRGTTAWKNGPAAFYNRPATDEEVKEWAAEGCSIGAILGERSGVIALEIDCPELVMPLLADLPTFNTPAATSPSAGYHLFFRYEPGIANLSVACPVFNDPASPCYSGKHELASIRSDGLLIALPPAPGREWLPRKSLEEVPPAEVPQGLIDLLGRITEKGKNLPIEQGAKKNPPIEHNPCSIGNTVLLEARGRYVLLEASTTVKKLAMDQGSPLIPALVKKLGGKGSRVPCPYHTPDNNPSANFWFNRGWYFADHHFTPACNVPVSQLCADLLTGYLERCGNGSSNHHQHKVFSLRQDRTFKIGVQAFVWLVLAAADLGVLQLPASRLPMQLDGFSAGGERVLRFIDRWARAYRYTFSLDVFPLARPFLISVVFALPSAKKDEPKEAKWSAAYQEVDKAIYRAKRQGLLEKVAPGVKGFGGKPALYRIVPPEEYQTRQDGGKNDGEG